MSVAVEKRLVVGVGPYDFGQRIDPFDNVFDTAVDVEDEGFDKIDCYLLWGGTDIHPSFYNQKRHYRNQAPLSGPSKRDVFEKKAVLMCREKNIPIIGICRGAQLLCAMAGGTVVQHVTGHHGMHKMITDTGEEIYTSSAHHQMMNPFRIPHKLIAWSDKVKSTCYEMETEEIDKQDTVMIARGVEPEIVYFPQIRGLGIQGHPEWGNYGRFQEYCCELVRQYLLENVDEVVAG